MVPVSKISAQLIEKWYLRVLKLVTKLAFDIAATISDAHLANRKFFAAISGGEMVESIANPFKEDSKTFSMFDSVHLFKNINNNLVNRRTFRCPSFDELYHQECANAGRFAFKLLDQVLGPKLIEKTNVLLANSCFHNSTIQALQGFWNHVNVKDTYAHVQLRDNQQQPIDFENQDSLNFLMQFDCDIAHHLIKISSGNKKACLCFTWQNQFGDARTAVFMVLTTF
ncbi:hypothetical protein TCAL_16415, partial [Tigriopus californicus]